MSIFAYEAHETGAAYRKSVLWDLDGVQIHSEPLHVKSWLTLAKLFGVQMTEADFDRNHKFLIPGNGGKMQEVCVPLRGAHKDVICYWIMHHMRMQGREIQPSLLQKMRAGFFDLYSANRHELRPRRGVAEIIGDLHGEGVIQATVTSSNRELVNINLSALPGVREKMEFIITSDDVTRPKPAPDPYELAMKKLTGVYGDNGGRMVFVAVEDSPTGVKAANSAGIPCVQFLMQGQKPMKPEDVNGCVMAARDARELKTNIEALFRIAAETQGAKNAKRPRRCRPSLSCLCGTALVP